MRYAALLPRRVCELYYQTRYFLAFEDPAVDIVASFFFLHDFT